MAVRWVDDPRVGEAVLTAADAAARAGLTASSWRADVARGRAPAPDALVGRTPVWKETTVDTHVAAGHVADLVELRDRAAHLLDRGQRASRVVDRLYAEIETLLDDVEHLAGEHLGTEDAFPTENVRGYIDELWSWRDAREDTPREEYQEERRRIAGDALHTLETRLLPELDDAVAVLRPTTA